MPIVITVAIARIADSADPVGQFRSSEGRANRASRLHELGGEIGRLTDAVAQMGLSDALRSRLAVAETERARLLETAESRPAMSQPSAERVGAKLREVAMRLDEAMKTDVPRARSISADLLGPTVIEVADDGIYAQMYTGPALRIAAGADVDGSGCGGRI